PAPAAAPRPGGCCGSSRPGAWRAPPRSTGPGSGRDPGAVAHGSSGRSWGHCGTHGGQDVSADGGWLATMEKAHDTLDLVGALHEQLDWHWQGQARPRLDGLTDEELHWEPTPGAWGVRRRGEASPSTVT